MWLFIFNLHVCVSLARAESFILSFHRIVWLFSGCAILRCASWNAISSLLSRVSYIYESPTVLRSYPRWLSYAVEPSIRWAWFNEISKTPWRRFEIDIDRMIVLLKGQMLHIAVVNEERYIMVEIDMERCTFYQQLESKAGERELPASESLDQLEKYFSLPT